VRAEVDMKRRKQNVVLRQGRIIVIELSRDKIYDEIEKKNVRRKKKGGGGGAKRVVKLGTWPT
jgi:hypothetical protein